MLPFDGAWAKAEERLRRLGTRPQDIEESFLRSGGPGGQNVNKVSTAVRLLWRPRAVAVVCQDERSQSANRLAARERLADRIEEVLRREREALRQAREKTRRASRKLSASAKARRREEKRRRAGVLRQRRYRAGLDD